MHLWISSTFAPLLLAAAVAAQGSSLCHFASDNTTFDDGVSMGGPNLLLGIKTVAPATLVVTRLEVWTGEATGTNSLALWTHDVGNNRPGTSLGSGSWSMTSINGWQGANINPPIVLNTGTDFWFVWGPINGAQATVELRGPAPGAQTYRGSFDGGQSWNGPFVGHLWKFRVICGGLPAQYQVFGTNCPGSSRSAPTLGFTGVPTIGQAMDVTVTRALASTSALLSIGASDTNWFSLNLPFDLTPFGAPNCRILCSVADFVVTATDSSGNGTANLAVPNDQSLLGTQFFDQWWIVDVAANPLNLVFSGGGRGTIGN